MQVLSIAWKVGVALIPTISKLVKATKKSSPGGKRITPEELAEVLGGVDLVGDVVGTILRELGVEVGAGFEEPTRLRD